MSSDDLAPGTAPLRPSDPVSIGPYRLEGRLGSGGQGTVYRGVGDDGRRTAIKLLHEHLITDATARSRFLDEVEITKRVAPFCTAQVLRTGVEDGRPYIVSEFIDGPSLQDSVARRGPRTGAALERLAHNTVTALAAIHRAGVVHRDFKPANVLLGPDGPVVIDFGIARALDLSRSHNSAVIGTPGYTAPEHLRGERAGPEADMFAWGATIHFAALGRRTFGGTSVATIMHAVLHEEPDLTGLEPSLAEVVRACLHKDPARRPTAHQVAERLRDLPGPVWHPGAPPAGAPTRPDAAAAERTAAPEPSRKPGRRGIRVAAAAAAVALVAGAAYAIAPALKGEEASNASEGPTEAARTNAAPAPPAASAAPPPTRSSKASPTARENTPNATRPSTRRANRTTPSLPFSGPNLHCGSWRSAVHGSPLQVRACTRLNVAGTSATFGMQVKNTGNEQLNVVALVKYHDGATKNCPQRSSPWRGISLAPRGSWWSDMGQCSVSGLTGASFQGAAWAMADPNGTTDPQLGTVKYSPNIHYNADGEPLCRTSDGKWPPC
ncbi:serine/threonine-protein kinase [Actinomadura sediminis]|uniref:Serine/threonine-protein kinase n=1 Tax=Actinomadura sediminis TaxID=1038904 RepID=A0ABW3ELZ6_9ACTN